jgi:hypothetical protein
MDPRTRDLAARIIDIINDEGEALTPGNPDNWPGMNVAKIYTAPSFGDLGGLSIRPIEHYYGETLTRYLAAVNKSYLYSGLFSNEGPYAVCPYSTSPTKFWLSAEEGERVTIEVFAGKHQNPGVQAQVVGKTVIIPMTKLSLIAIQLGLGENWIEITQGTSIFRYLVFATRLAGIATTISKVIYDSSGRQLEELRSDLLAPISSRLLEHTLPYADLIPSARVLKVMGVRGSTLARLLHPASEFGLRTLLDAIVGNTSNIQDVPTYPDEVDPADDPSYLREQRFAKDAFAWLPNRDVIRREALVRLAVNMPEVFPLVDVNVREVVIDSPHMPEEVHQFEHFDFSEDLIEQDPDLLLGVSALRSSELAMCVVMFLEHQEVARCSGLGRRFFDCGEFDAGVDLDWEDDFDPMSDGWVGFPLTEGHRDPRACIGIQPVAIPEESNCCWLWGLPMTALNAQLTEPDAVTDPSIEWLIHFFPPD